MTESSQSGSEPSDTLEDLSGFVHELAFDDIPAPVVEREKWHLLDTLGCMLYGTTRPWVQKVERALSILGEQGAATVPGSGARLPAARAALVGGTAAHSMDFDDHCQEAGVHAGSATVPTALAFAETHDRPVSGRELLTALTAGVEVGIRSGFGIGYGSVGEGWHIAGWTGAFAGAATTGTLLGLSPGPQGHALAVAGTQGCGLLGAQYGTDVKRFHMGKAAEAGYLGAFLADESFTGDTGIFAERYGSIGPTMSDDYDTDAVTADLGREYRLMDKLVFKPFPSVGQVHAPVDGLRTALEENDVDTDDVESVVVRTTSTVKDHVGWEYEPVDVMSAQANIQYAIATFLLDGSVDVDSYTESAIRRPEVLSRVSDVSVVVDEAIAEESFGAVVDVDTSQETYTTAVETPLGYPENPMTDDQLLEKFRKQASKPLDDDAVETIIDRVLDIEAEDDVSELLGLLSPSSQ